MNRNKKVTLLLIISFVLVSFGVGIPEFCRWGSENFICMFGRALGLTNEPAIFFASSSVIISVLLMFVKSEVFDLWKKFAIPYFIIYLIITMIPINRTGSMGTGPYITEEILAMFLSGIFLISSIVLITYKSIQLKNYLK